MFPRVPFARRRRRRRRVHAQGSRTSHALDVHAPRSRVRVCRVVVVLDPSGSSAFTQPPTARRASSAVAVDREHAIARARHRCARSSERHEGSIETARPRSMGLNEGKSLLCASFPYEVRVRLHSGSRSLQSVIGHCHRGLWAGYSRSRRWTRRARASSADASFGRT